MKRVLTYRHWVVWGWFLVAACCLPGVCSLRIDNSPEVFFVRDAEKMLTYRRFQMDFGRDRAVRLVLKGKGIWTAVGLSWLANLEQAAAGLHGVFGVAGLYTRHRRDVGAWPPDHPGEFRDAVRSDPLDRNAGWVTRNGDMATVLVALYNLPAAKQHALLNTLEGLLAAPPPGIDASLAGLPVIQDALDRMLTGFSVRFFPPLAVMAGLVLMLALKQLRRTLPPFAQTAVTLIVVFGIMGYSGAPLNMVTIIIPPILFVVSFATSVHILLHVRRFQARGLPEDEAVLAAFREKTWPVLWTGLTTMAGFGSLAVSAAPPVRSLGIWVGSGMALLTLAALTLLPALLGRPSAPAPGSGVDATPFERWAGKIGGRWARFATSRPLTVGLLFVCGTAVALGGIHRLKEESDILSYFPQDHPARLGVEEVGGRGVGVVSAELIIRSGAAGEAPFHRAETWDVVAGLAKQLKEEPAILGVVSAADVFASVASWAGDDPGAGERPSNAMALAADRPDTRTALSVLRTADGAHARISLLIEMESFQRTAPLLERARRLGEACFPGMTVEVTGQYPLVLFAQEAILETMIKALCITFGIIGSLFAALTRSPLLAARVIAPNLFPVAAALGCMGWLDIPLDGTTLMVASAALGLAVDDTLHSLGAWRREIKKAPPKQAAAAAVEKTAPAHILSSLILVLGFGLCGLSTFAPIARFGFLTALAITAALLADLLLVPALLGAHVERPGRRSL